jgi:peptide alpha-N-acetyltransferase
MTLRAYIGVLKLEDKLRDHPFYSACAKLAIEIYVYLHDNPSAKSAKLNGPTAPEEQLSASELKKLHRKQKKAQLKAQAAKAAEEKTRESKTHGKGGGGEEDKKVEEREPKLQRRKPGRARPMGREEEEKRTRRWRRESQSLTLTNYSRQTSLWRRR